MEHRRVPPGTAPGVSVIMAVYNGEATVERAIASVQAQTYGDWELLVVDDASTDGSAEKVLRLAAQDDRIRLLRAQVNSGGPAGPRNRGLLEASGTVLCLLDQDDLWSPEKLQAQTAKLRSGGFGLVYSDAHVQRPGLPTELYSRLWGPMVEGQVAGQLMAGCFIPALTAAVPRAVAAEVGLFDEELSGVDDYDYWLRIALAGHAVGFVDAPLATWVVGERSLSHRHAQQLERLATCLSAQAAAHPEHRGVARHRVAELQQALWELEVRDYIGNGGFVPLLRSARTATRLLDVARATLTRTRQRALYGRRGASARRLLRRRSS